MSEESRFQLPDDLLVRELSDVRQRGLDAVDRDTSKQRRLLLPELEEVLANSPWAGGSRRQALREMLTFAVTRVSDRQVGNALRALYGLEEQAKLTSHERKAVGLTWLRVSARASVETQKVAIRDARYAFARAIRAAERAHFHRPSFQPRDDDNQLREEVLDVLRELKKVRMGLGATAERLKKEAPETLKLPGTLDQLSRAPDSDVGEAAMQFLRCAVRQPRMAPEHHGLLVEKTLNLSQSGRSYAQRCEDWMLQTDDLDESSFEDHQHRAFVRFAMMIVELSSSPCATDFDPTENAKFADHLFGLLKQLDASRHPDVAERVIYRMLEEIPGLSGWLAQNDEPEAPLLERFDHLLVMLEPELQAWEMQYRASTDRHAPFLWNMPRQLLMNALRGELPFTASRDEVLYETVMLHFQSRQVRLDSGLVSPGDNLQIATEITLTAYEWTLRLLSQILVYNEKTNFWPLLPPAPTPHDMEYMPVFPILPIGQHQFARH